MYDLIFHRINIFPQTNEWESHESGHPDHSAHNVIVFAASLVANFGEQSVAARGNEGWKRSDH